jgi:two-component system chemotaxis response regulator CheY
MAMKALVVDDSRAMRMILKRHLSGQGFQVVEAEHGEDALARLREPGASFQVALVDWNMPVMSGIELVRAIRSDQVLAPLPILMVTSEAEMSSVGEALDAGASEYLMKPFTAEALHDKLGLMGVGP